ncbi:arylsulfatase [Paenibacillus allorhizosphaerae]|uniref:N-acetylgalactosamine-6-O-sulfatase n=1 Tax=Paenibacillus allorhizosphaerae TaxID=2849866 RepID=A0ABM8VQJ9_9BACL|nr:arylsulfatase [Paenibacillus allorhizosphaerae]CAG7654339.1 N-acetylgalactosamine-6-O-sulfatase [Paenibacillus allorhizosphaerae]
MMKSSAGKADERPNIVYILADDLGYGDLSCYGATLVQTPHLDRLAKEGIRFTDAHSPSAVCTPTRYGILTGRYCWRSEMKKGVLNGYSQPLIEEGRMTVASMLQQSGYATACIGKWHLGLGWTQISEKPDDIDYNRTLTHGPVQLGFDYFYGISASLDMPPYCFIENDRVVDPTMVPKHPYNDLQESRGGLMSAGWKDEDVNGVHTAKAVDFIRRQAEQQSERPFFLYLPLTGPHTPWTAAEPFRGKSGVGRRGDMIMELDWTVGQIVDTLENLGIREQTMIIFASDNGPHPQPQEAETYGHRATGPLRGIKAGIWDGGHRIPYIMSWTGKIKPGQVYDELIDLVDFMGTAAAIAGQTLPAHAGEDSFNQLPLLLGQPLEQPIRKYAIHHSLQGMFSIRDKDWKYIEGRGSGGFDWNKKKSEESVDEPAGQLYFIREDIAERNNLYDKLPEVVNELGKVLDLTRTQSFTRPIDRS